MSAELKRSLGAAGHESEIRALTSMTGFPEDEVRTLFEGELRAWQAAPPSAPS